MIVDPIAIQGRSIGAGAPCFIIAEAGVNHNGDLALAHRLVDAAADAGADAVKFQTFDADALASADAPSAAYQQLATGQGSQRDMLRRLTLDEPAHIELKRHADARGIIFLSTPFESASVELLERLQVPAFKVPSGELTNHLFLRLLAQKGKPLLVSTGMSELAEVEAAVRVLLQAQVQGFALLHCTSSYPAPLESVNLRAMQTLRSRFAVPVGYSDHTLGTVVPVGAVALGAKVLEKHLTLSRTMTGPDHAASMEPDEMARLVKEVRAIEAALGDGEKIVQPCERETQRVARKSLFVARDLPVGHRLSESDLVARRPGTGISPALLEEVLGRTLRRALPADAMLDRGDLE